MRKSNIRNSIDRRSFLGLGFSLLSLEKILAQTPTGSPTSTDTPTNTPTDTPTSTATSIYTPVDTSTPSTPSSPTPRPPYREYYCNPSHPNAIDQVGINHNPDTPSKTLQYLYDILDSFGLPEGDNYTIHATGGTVQILGYKPRIHIIGNLDYWGVRNSIVDTSSMPDISDITEIIMIGGETLQDNIFTNVKIKGVITSSLWENSNIEYSALTIWGYEMALARNIGNMIIYDSPIGARMDEDSIGNNVFFNCDLAVMFYGQDATTVVRNNIFRNNAQNLSNMTNEELDARYNDWGVYTEEEIEALLSGNVAYVPFINPLSVDEWVMY